MNTRVLTQAKPAAISAPPVRSNLLQRKCACGGTPGPTGECDACKKKRLGLQTKLKVNEPGDIYEQEANRIAHQVMTSPASSAVRAAPPCIQCLSGLSKGAVDLAPPSVDQALASTGRPLEPTLRHDMEQRFGHDFSRVRVHSDTAAEQSADEVNAKAYTMGHHIVFGAGQFIPETDGGRRLLAHELTHVVQQTGANASHTGQTKEKRTVSGIDPAATHPAVGTRIAVNHSSPLRIARTPDDSFEEDEEFRRHMAEDKAKGRRKGERIRRRDIPPSGADVTRDTERKIQQMIQKAKDGGYHHVNTPNRQRATRELRRLLAAYEASEIQRINDKLATTPKGKEREALVAQKRGIVKTRVDWQFEFDEAVRTPKGSNVQQKWKSGGAARPYQETRPQRGGYAQPDFSILPNSEPGGGTRYHVNLKSHDLTDINSVDARKVARAVLKQATKNAIGDPTRRGHVGHLPAGDRLIISFIDQPDPKIQQEMNKIMMRQKSPITEVRFGTATHYKPPDPPAPPPKSPGKPRKPAAKKPNKPAAKKPQSTAVKVASTTQSIFETSTTAVQAGSKSSVEPTTSKANVTKTLPVDMTPPVASPLPKGSIFETHPLAPPRMQGVPYAPTDATIGTPSTAPNVATESPPTKGGTPDPQLAKVPPAETKPAARAGGTLKSGRVTVDYDFDGKSTRTMKVAHIDLSDYPPDRDGPVTRFFRKGPTLQKLGDVGSVGSTVLSLVGEAAGGETQKKINMVLHPIQSYFEYVLNKARADFRAHFPDAGTFVQKSRIAESQKSYEAALSKMRSPAATRAMAATMLALTPDKDRDAAWYELARNLPTAGIRAEDLRTFQEAGSVYEKELADLQVELDRYRVLLPDIVADVSQRAAVLAGAGQDLEDAFWSVIRSPVMAIPLLYYQSFRILHVAGTFQALAGRMSGFASEIRSQADSYSRLWESLDAQIVQVGKQLTNWESGRGRGRVKFSPSPPSSTTFTEAEP